MQCAALWEHFCQFKNALLSSFYRKYDALKCSKLCVAKVFTMMCTRYVNTLLDFCMVRHADMHYCRVINLFIELRLGFGAPTFLHYFQYIYCRRLFIAGRLLWVEREMGLLKGKHIFKIYCHNMYLFVYSEQMPS